MKIEKVSIKVVIHTTNGKQFWGQMFIDKDQRLQDLLNDNRSFLPYYGLVDNNTASKAVIERMTLLNKNSIFSIEEIK